MSLPAVSFTNNLGTITFERALLEIADQWQVTAQGVRATKSVRVHGQVHRDDAFRFNSMQSSASGERGTLTLPWTSVGNLQLRSLATPDGVWLDWLDVTAEFDDEDPESNEYTVDFFGIELINPRFALSLPFRQVRDDTVQMPLTSFALIDPANPAFSTLRMLETHDNMTLELSGTWVPPRDLDLDAVTEKLSRRSGTQHVNVTEMPAGYPQVFDVQDFSESVATWLPLRKLWVAQSQIAFDVEKGQAEISVSMEMPPQKLSN